MTEEHRRFHREVINLLLHIAWADRDLDDDELRVVLDFARRYKLSEPELDELGEQIAGRRPLREVDLELLRGRRQDVLIAAQTLLLSDAAVVASERELLSRIEAALDPD